jgi:hypothetical protein
MLNQAPEEFVQQIKKAILAWDPMEVDTYDELACRKAAYYIKFGYVDGERRPITDGDVYYIYDVIKFVGSYEGE